MYAAGFEVEQQIRQVLFLGDLTQVPASSANLQRSSSMADLALAVKKNWSARRILLFPQLFFPINVVICFGVIDSSDMERKFRMATCVRNMSTAYLKLHIVCLPGRW